MVEIITADQVLPGDKLRVTVEGDASWFDQGAIGVGGLRFSASELRHAVTITRLPATPPSGDFSIGGTLWPGLSKLLEESGEAGAELTELLVLRSISRLQQVGGKLMGSRGDTAHFDGTDLKTRLEDELADLQAAIEWFVGHNGLDTERMEARTFEKLDTFDKWHAAVKGAT